MRTKTTTEPRQPLPDEQDVRKDFGEGGVELVRQLSSMEPSSLTTEIVRNVVLESKRRRVWSFGSRRFS